MRGKRRASPARTLCARLIPACAGKTSTVSSRASRIWAHPRVCGENIDRSRVPAVVTGSSPRVRGKPLPVEEEAPAEGLIPACAGKTGRIQPRGYPARAHPRVCGENPKNCAGAGRRRGSSPRVRGKPVQGLGKRFLPGLIPACAGKTCSTAWPCRRPWAHPRVCGENHRRNAPNGIITGSSPGGGVTRPVVVAGGQAGGRIPAWAGKPGAGVGAGACAGAHPRVCGENPPGGRANQRPVGSSPRVRGKRPRTRPRPPIRRLIPACAGKTY